MDGGHPAWAWQALCGVPEQLWYRKLAKWQELEARPPNENE